MDFKELIESLYRLHYASMNFNHMVEYGQGNWTLFEPSRFIYTYFAFNSMYSIDWKTSLNEREIYPFEVESGHGETAKAKILIDFIYEKLPQEVINDLFYEYVINHYEESNFIDLVHSIGKAPMNMSNSERLNFIDDLILSYRRRELTKGKLKQSIVRFIMMVRNNVFHGTKDFVKMTEKKQRGRLELYTKILNFINVCVFEILEENTNIIFEKKLKFRL